MIRKFLKAPMINDITTDPSLEFQGCLNEDFNRKRDMSYPSDFSKIQKELHPEVQPVFIPRPPEEVFQFAKNLATQRGWRLIDQAQRPLHLEAVATTSLLRFKDDLILRFDQAKDSAGCIVHMRSKSRLGRSDLGANAQRIVQFLGELKRLIKPRPNEI